MLMRMLQLFEIRRSAAFDESCALLARWFMNRMTDRTAGAALHRSSLARGSDPPGTDRSPAGSRDSLERDAAEPSRRIRDGSPLPPATAVARFPACQLPSIPRREKNQRDQTRQQRIAALPARSFNADARPYDPLRNSRDGLSREGEACRRSGRSRGNSRRSSC